MHTPISRFRTIAFGAFVVFLSMVASAEAGWHHRHGCGSCGSHRHHGWHRGSHGGCHGSAGGSSGGSCHGGSAGGTASAPKAADAAPAAATKKVAWSGPADGAMLVVEVPEDAKLFINGSLTSLAGGVRNFATTGLTADKQYEYELKMVVDRGGKAVEQTRTVWLSAGEEQTVSLTSAEAAVAAETTKPATTHLTLRVPEDARVWIEGHLTSPTGAVRTFSTGAIRNGENWEGYEIRVARVVDGREVAVVKSITLTGGRDIELAIDPSAQSPAVDATASLR